MNGVFPRAVECTADKRFRVGRNGEIINKVFTIPAPGRLDKTVYGVIFSFGVVKETAEMRLLYPSLPLSELANKFAPPLTKSGLNNRLKKIMELAN